MKNLYNIKEEYQDLMIQIEEIEGEITDEIADKLVIHEQERDGKSFAYVCVIREKEATISMLDQEINRLSAMRKREQKAIENLEYRLLTAVKLFGEYAAGMFTIGTRKSTSVLITDEENIPDRYLKESIKITIDKKMVANSLKAGEKLEFAELQENKNLKIK